MAQESVWSTRPVRFVRSRGCVEVGAAAGARCGHRRRGRCAGRMRTTANAALTAASEAIRRTIVRENAAADAGQLFDVDRDDYVGDTDHNCNINSDCS